MTGHTGVNGIAPFAAHRVQVGVANPAKQNVECDISRAGSAAFKRLPHALHGYSAAVALQAGEKRV